MLAARTLSNSPSSGMSRSTGSSPMGSLHWLLHFVECVPPATSLEHPISLFDLLFFADIVPTINEGVRNAKINPQNPHMEHFIDVIIIL